MSILKRVGGKHYLADWIISLMPPHIHYVEPYFGSGAVLFKKDCSGISEVVNDIDGDLMAFWRVLASEQAFPVFQRRCQATPFSQELWRESGERLLRNKADKNLSDMQRAYYFFIFARQSMEGACKNFAPISRNRTRRKMNEQVSAWWSSIDGLETVHNRLKRVLILNDKAVNVIRSNDGANAFFYLDPTYYPSTRSANLYEFEMSANDHKLLLDELVKIKGKFMISSYPNDLYAKYAEAHGWNVASINIDVKMSTSKQKSERTECLFMNY